MVKFGLKQRRLSKLLQLPNVRGYKLKICFPRNLQISPEEFFFISILHLTLVSSLFVNLTLSCFITVCDRSLDYVS